MEDQFNQRSPEEPESEDLSSKGELRGDCHSKYWRDEEPTMWEAHRLYVLWPHRPRKTSFSFMGSLSRFGFEPSAKMLLRSFSPQRGDTPVAPRISQKKGLIL